MVSVLRIGAAMACAAAVVAMAGCAKPFPERLNWYGNDPMLYSTAFSDAATAAVVHQRTSTEYYAYFGETAYTMMSSVQRAPCDADSLQAFLRKERSCRLVQRFPDDSCRNANGCMIFRVDADLFSDPALRAVVEQALSRPCESLTQPQQVKYYRHSGQLGMAASESWRLLQCDGAGVFGRDIAYDNTSGIYRVHFYRGE